MFRYFLTGLKFAWDMVVFRYLMFFLSLFIIFIISRRLVAVYHSGGSFFTDFHIAKGNFYIHNSIFFGKRIIPLNDIKAITINCIKGIKNSGRRYIFHIERKKGRNINIFLGKTKNNDRLIDNLKKETKKYHIRISK